MTDVAEVTDDDLFARRVTRYEEITRLLRGLRRDYARVQGSKIQAKADIYANNLAKSHAERQGMASAQTAILDSESLTIKAEIEVLEDERQMLETLIQWVS